MKTSMFGENAVAMENMERRCEKRMIVNLRPNLSDITPLETAPEKQTMKIFNFFSSLIDK